MRRTVVITNKTKFCTRAIRSMILAVARHELKKSEYRNLAVEIAHPRRDFVTGKALIGRVGNTAKFSVYIPKTQTDMVEVAHRVKVCLDYVRGRHGGSDGTIFRDWYDRKGKADDYKYLPVNTIPAAAPKVPRPKGAEAALGGMENAQERLVYWEARLKRAKNAVKKWKRKVNYYANRTEKLGAAEAQAKQAVSMTAEEFSKLPPVKEQ